LELVQVPHSRIQQAARVTQQAQGNLLVGAKVSGYLTFPPSPTNWFDYQNGQVPAGYGNSPNTLPIDIPVGPTTEFAYGTTPADFLFTADLNAVGYLDIREQLAANKGPRGKRQYKLVSSAFRGLVPFYSQYPFPGLDDMIIKPGGQHTDCGISSRAPTGRPRHTAYCVLRGELLQWTQPQLVTNSVDSPTWELEAAVA
jgi:hypothetical protein